MSLCKWCGVSVSPSNDSSFKSRWQRWKCKGCGSFGYTNNPTQDQLNELYRVAWENAEKSGRFATGSTDKKIALSLLKAVEYTSESGICLDYGGGKGHLSEALIEKGCKSLTVFEPYGVNPGLPVSSWISNWEEIGDRLFDWIFMIEVVEHLLDPETELKKIKQHLSANGKCVITTPNAKGWRARIEEFNWREVQNPTHINLFSEKSLRICLDRAGFSSVERLFRPVSYKATGLASLVLAMTQRFGIDGGLRFIASNGCR